MPTNSTIFLMCSLSIELLRNWERGREGRGGAGRGEGRGREGRGGEGRGGEGRGGAGRGGQGRGWEGGEGQGGEGRGEGRGREGRGGEGGEGQGGEGLGGRGGEGRGWEGGEGGRGYSQFQGKGFDQSASQPSHNPRTTYQLTHTHTHTHTHNDKQHYVRHTFLCVVHPVQHDLRSSAMSGGYITSHNLRFSPRKSEIQQPYFILFIYSYIAGFDVLCVEHSHIFIVIFLLEHFFTHSVNDSSRVYVLKEEKIMR